MLAEEETRNRIAKPANGGEQTFSLGYVKNKYGQVELKRIENNESNYAEYRRTEATDIGSYRMHVFSSVHQQDGVRSLYSK